MATTIFEPCKIRKRKPRLLGFQNFASPGSIIDLHGPFRDNIRLFLQEYAQIEDQYVSRMPTWSIPLVTDTNGVVFPLYVIEETVQHPLNPFCDHCKFVGWSHHFVSKRRYHMIIPAGDNWNNLEIRTHILHGLIHCNGYGHLLSINEDLNSLRGSDIMNLWDRICTALRTRKISVTDVCMEKSMDLRLLHGVAYGHNWFGKWGYKFCRGTYGVTEQKYERAIQFLGTLNLDKIIKDFKNSSRGGRIEQIICNYREVSETQLNGLLQFMLQFKSSAPMTMPKYSSPNPSSHQNDSHILNTPIDLSTFVSSIATNDCRWPERRLKYTVMVIVNLLEDSNGAMPRQELRAGARYYVGDTGLIDFVLKSIKCIAVGNKIVSRSTNPSTKLSEFKIHGVGEDKSVEQLNNFASSVAKFGPRWPEQRLEQAAEVVVNILKENKAMLSGNENNGAMSRNELREAARQCIGDTGLIDFVLKSIDNSMIGNQIVCRSKNPSTNLIEFAIRDENMAPNVHEDVLILYENVLLGYPEWDSVSLASGVVLDSKYFVKEWVFEDMKDQLMTLTCRVLPSFDELEAELTRPLPPGELVMVSPSMTIGELKLVAQCALRDTYCVMDRFVVTQIGGLKGIEDERVLSCAVEAGAEVWVRGCGLDLDTKLRYQGGSDKWTVDCVCGARGDDGEMMVACDACHVWQHTRCSGIDGDDPARWRFLCGKCSR